MWQSLSGREHNPKYSTSLGNTYRDPVPSWYGLLACAHVSGDIPIVQPCGEQGLHGIVQLLKPNSLLAVAWSYELHS